MLEHFNLAPLCELVRQDSSINHQAIRILGYVASFQASSIKHQALGLLGYEATKRYIGDKGNTAKYVNMQVWGYWKRCKAQK